MLSSRYSLVAIIALAACTTKEARRSDTAAPATATLAGAPSAAVDVAAVRQTIEATNARFGTAAVKGDTAALVGFYAEDAVIMWPNMPATSGRQAIVTGFAGWLSQMKFTALKLQTQDIVTAGDYAVETGKYEQTAQLKGGKSIHDVGKYVVVWKKQADGSYKILRDINNSDLPMK